MGKQKHDEIAGYGNDHEAIANSYVMRCFTVTMVVFSVVFLMNVLGIFVVDHELMLKAYIPSLTIYFIMAVLWKRTSLSKHAVKYVLLTSIILVFTLISVYLTYHAVLIALLPFLYATLYTSPRIMMYVYVLTVISTVVSVYGGYFFGICDANMLFLTAARTSDYLVNGQVVGLEPHANPCFALFLFFVLPRCLVYVAFVYICRSIYSMVSGSLEKARLTDELAVAKEEAERANRAKTQFLVRVSHEIRTPINAVMGMNEMILRESKEENTIQYARNVKDSSVMLLNIVNEILDSAKIESGKMEIMNQNYEMGSLVHDLYNMVLVKAEEKGLGFEIEIDPTMPRAFYGDDKRIKQILLNLLTNAVKYTEKGKVMLSISHRREGENAILRYSVKDTGIGIKPEDIEKVSDVFQRLDVSRNRDVEGSGLGMNIVQQLLQLMGSELQIQSEYEKGSEFSFELVQKVVKEEALGDFRKRIEDAGENALYHSNFKANRAKVLVVDDSPMNLKVFRGLLKQTDIQVIEAQSGMECLELMSRERFHLIFLDHMMPEMDGVETLHIIKEKQFAQGVPIIMLTANAIVGDRERYIGEGFDDFLSKPIIPEKLDKMLLKYLPAELIVPVEAEVIHEQQPVSVKTEVLFEQIVAAIPELDVNAGLIICNGEKDFYAEIVGDFVALTIKERLQKAFEAGDSESYCIQVHGFKNNAYSIGATRLGDLAFEIEQASKHGFAEHLPELQRQMFEQYDEICRKYNQIRE